MKQLVIGIVLTAIVITPAAAQMPKYGVTVNAEKNVDFAKFSTYSWTTGQPSAVKEIDTHVKDAVDRELAALGMRRAATGPGDVLVAYYSLSRTDVDLKGKPDSKGALPQYAVGTLMVALLDPSSRHRLLRLRVDTPIDSEPTKLAATIDDAVAALFAKYPTRRRK
jgi:Domain of unknown function (DUF4136)